MIHPSICPSLSPSLPLSLSPPLPLSLSIRSARATFNHREALSEHKAALSDERQRSFQQVNRFRRRYGLIVLWYVVLYTAPCLMG